MQMPKQSPSLRRNRRLHPKRGRFTGQPGVMPSQEPEADDMDDSDDGDDGDSDGD